MKKLLTLTAVGVILTSPTLAVQKCVALDFTNAGEGDYDGNQWYVTYPNAFILGEAIYSKSNVDSQVEFFAKAEFVDLSNTPSENEYCWCRMLKPFVSYWMCMDITATVIASMGSSCAKICADAFSSTTDLYLDARDALFEEAL